MTAYATVSDLVGRWRPLSSTADTQRATVLLEDAAEEIRSEFAREGWTVEGRIAEGAVTERALLITSVEMVKRAMLAPVDQAPMQQMQQTAGPFSQSGTFVNPTGDLYLTKKDRRRLGLGGQQAFTVASESSWLPVHAPYCAYLWDGEACTCGAVA